MVDAVQQTDIRNALPDDASRVWRLKVRAFPARYLAFTPYRRTNAETLLRRAAEDMGFRFRLAEFGPRIVGYSLSRIFQDRLHLSYIATSPPESGRGIGSMLLEDFERAASEMGRATLDVFESNEAAHPWYERHGYREVKSSHSCLIDLPIGHGTTGPPPQPVAEALKEEARYGFADLAGIPGYESVAFRLFGGDSVRVAGFEGQLSDLAEAVEAAFGSKRSRLIAVGLSAPPEVPHGGRAERLITMEKRF